MPGIRREIAAKRYAEAVFQIARDQGTIDAWLRDLQTIGAVFAEPEVLGLLESAKVPPQAREDVLRRTLAGVSPLALNFARLLVQRRRVALAPQVTDFFRELADAYRGVAHAEVVTAVEIGDAERQLIAQRLGQLTGKQVQIETRVDPSIIGGVVARVGDRLIDGSARTRLLALRHRLEAAR
ncbi:MAG TPA: ATP synthase F1 subunit delta [Dehalococcoidia bacterium]|nr:ATP synthase F1 subunit delta [Dehalococcoidia bacterium]